MPYSVSYEGLGKVVDKFLLANPRAISNVLETVLHLTVADYVCPDHTICHPHDQG